MSALPIARYRPNRVTRGAKNRNEIAPPPRLVVVGNLTIDDVVLPDGTTRMASVGGNSLYAALGARPWQSSIGVVTRRGDDFPRDLGQELASLGIANTMYSAVLERTREIGVLKALGARSHDVLLLFVAEAALIGLVGGIIGTVAAVVLAQAGNTAVDRLAQSVAGAGIDVFRTDAGIAAAALLLAVVLSTVSGLLPALRAAVQDPVRALRYE